MLLINYNRLIWLSRVYTQVLFSNKNIIIFQWNFKNFKDVMCCVYVMMCLLSYIHIRW